MKFSEFVERYIFVRRCAGCGALMGYESKNDAFCAPCRIRWEMAKVEPCDECGRAMVECECMPKKLSKSGLLTLKKLISYESAKTSKPENRMLYFLKHHKNRRIARFAAEQLSHRIYELQRELDAEVDSFLITYIPRTNRALAEYGFDQSKEVCRELSGLTGIDVISIFERSKGNREQKKLNSRQRAKNASKSIVVCRKNIEDITFKGKNIILFDDIVSSGASMSRAVELLHRAGAKNIFGLSVAYTKINRIQNYRK